MSYTPSRQNPEKGLKVDVKSGPRAYPLQNIRIKPNLKWYLNGSEPTLLNKNRIPAILPALFVIFLSLNPQFKDPEI